jgi:hypothetical protein
MDAPTPSGTERPATAGSAARLATWKKMLFGVVLALLIVAPLELAARWYMAHFEGFDGKHLLQYEFDPYKNLLPTRNFHDTRGIVHNSAGFRRAGEVARQKPEGVYRIFLMGGSTAYGTGGLWPHLQREYAVLDNSHTIDAYLERYLAESFPGAEFEVVNAGIPSIWTHHEHIYLNQQILRYSPDMVVFLDGFNDFYFTGEDHDQFASYAYKEHSHVIMGPPTMRALATANVWWISRKSAFAHLGIREARNVSRFAGSLRARRGERDPIDVETALAGLERTYRNNALPMVRRNVHLLELEGVIPVFVLQPMLILERKRYASMPEIERRLFDFNVDAYLPNYEAFIARAVPLVSTLTRAEVEAGGGVYLDGTTAFREAEGQIFTDYAHLTPTGNAILARRIADRIAPLVRPTPADPAAE